MQITDAELLKVRPYFVRASAFLNGIYLFSGRTTEIKKIAYCSFGSIKHTVISAKRKLEKVFDVKCTVFGSDSFFFFY